MPNHVTSRWVVRGDADQLQAFIDAHLRWEQPRARRSDGSVPSPVRIFDFETIIPMPATYAGVPSPPPGDAFMLAALKARDWRILNRERTLHLMLLRRLTPVIDAAHAAGMFDGDAGQAAESMQRFIQRQERISGWARDPQELIQTGLSASRLLAILHSAAAMAALPDGLAEQVAALEDVEIETPEGQERLLEWYATDLTRRLTPTPEELERRAARRAEMRELYEENNEPDLTPIEIGERAYYNQTTYGYPDWYGWSNASWGTKWNAYELDLVRDTADTGEIEFTFQTAWSFPDPILDALVERWPDLRFAIVAFDEGWCFALELSACGRDETRIVVSGDTDDHGRDWMVDLYTRTYGEPPEPDEDEEEEETEEDEGDEGDEGVTVVDGGTVTTLRLVMDHESEPHAPIPAA